MAYRTMLLVSIFVALLCGQVETAKADHSTSDLNHSYPEESLEEIGEELARVLADHLYEYLQRELNRLKKGTLESKEVLREKISQYEAGIKKNPNDAESRYILGQIYDEIGDGANAIIQTKMAEELFAREKNVKGVAECRRNLRMYFKDYGFQPGDFALIR